MSNPNLDWFAIRVKSRCERAVSDALRHKGYDEFLPLYWSRRRWSDRVKVDAACLFFPGYLFCRFDLARSRSHSHDARRRSHRRPRKNSSADRVDRSGEGVDAIRLALNSGQQVIPWPGVFGSWQVGEKLKRSSLRGLEGVVLRFKGAAHLILGVQLLQRAVALESSRELGFTVRIGASGRETFGRFCAFSQRSHLSISDMRRLL